MFFFLAGIVVQGAWANEVACLQRLANVVGEDLALVLLEQAATVDDGHPLTLRLTDFVVDIQSATAHMDTRGQKEGFHFWLGMLRQTDAPITNCSLSAGLVSFTSINGVRISETSSGDFRAEGGPINRPLTFDVIGQ